MIVLADILPRHLKTQDTDGHRVLAVAVQKNCARLVYFFKVSVCVLNRSLPLQKVSGSVWFLLIQGSSSKVVTVAQDESRDLLSFLARPW